MLLVYLMERSTLKMNSELHYLNTELELIEERRKALAKAKKELLTKDKYHYVLVNTRKRRQHADHYVKSYDTENFRTNMYFDCDRCDGIDFYDNKGNLIYQYRNRLTDFSQGNYYDNRNSEAKAIQQLLLTKLKEDNYVSKNQ